MKSLIVVSNPNSSSFNHRLATVAKETLCGLGGEVTVLDLYEVDFALSNQIADFTHEYDSRQFDYKNQQRIARGHDSFVPSLKETQRLIEEADLLILQFPLWWFSMPAIMKNWIEKAFAFDFAYNGRERRWFSSGPFRGKRAMLSLTTSGSERIYQDNAINGDMMKILWPIHNGILNFTGFQVLPPFICWGSDTSARDHRHLYEESLAERLRGLDSLQPLCFHPLEHFDDNYVLRSEYGAAVYDCSSNE